MVLIISDETVEEARRRERELAQQYTEPEPDYGWTPDDTTGGYDPNAQPDYGYGGYTEPDPYADMYGGFDQPAPYVPPDFSGDYGVVQPPESDYWNYDPYAAPEPPPDYGRNFDMYQPGYEDPNAPFAQWDSGNAVWNQGQGQYYDEIRNGNYVPDFGPIAYDANAGPTQGDYLLNGEPALADESGNYRPYGEAQRNALDQMYPQDVSTWDAIRSIPGAVNDWYDGFGERLSDPGNQPDNFVDALMGRGSANINALTGQDSAELPWGIRQAAETAADPINWAGLGVGGPGFEAFKVGVPFGRTIAGVADPILDASRSPLARAGAEFGINTLGQIGGENAAGKAAEYTDNPWLIGAAGIAGGLGAGVAGLGLAGGSKGPIQQAVARSPLRGLGGSIIEDVGPPQKISNAMPAPSDAPANLKATWNPAPERLKGLSPEQTTATQDFSQWLGKQYDEVLTGARGEQVHAGRVEQSARLTEASRVADERGLTGEARAHLEMSALAGRILDYAEDVPASVQSLRDEWYSLASAAYPPGDFARVKAYTALGKVFDPTAPRLQPQELRQLGELLGVPVERIAGAVRGEKPTLTDQILSVVGLPRAIKAGLELSASLRQALPLGRTHPVSYARSFATEVRSYVSEKAFTRAMSAIDASPMAAIRERAGLYMAHLATSIGEREEAFATALAGKIPLIKNAERAYVAMLDSLRARVFDSTVAAWRAEGRTFGDEDLKSLASYINHWTGRGTGQALDELGRYASVPFFAPRYWASKFQSIWDLKQATPAVRGEVVKSLAAYIAWTSSLAGLSYVATGKVNLNPLSGGAGVVGTDDFQYDVTDNKATEIRNVARIIMGERVTRSGETISANRLDTLAQYLRGKANVTPGIAWDLLGGVDFDGNTIKFDSPKAVGAYTWDAFGNLFINDVYKSYKTLTGDGIAFMDFVKLAGITLAAALGASPRIDNSIQNKLDDLVPGGDFYDLPKDQQAALLAANPELAAAKDANDKRRLDAAEYALARQGSAMATVGYDQVAQIKDERLKKEADAANAYASAPHDLTSARAFREEMGVIQRNAAVATDATGSGFQLWKDGDRQPKDANDAALFAYFAIRDKYSATPTGEIKNWDGFDAAVESEKLKWGPEQKAFVDSKLGNTEHAPEAAWFYDYKDAVRDSGYWELRDAFWTKFATDPQSAKFGVTPEMARREDWEFSLKQAEYDKYRSKFSSDSLAWDAVDQGFNNWNVAETLDKEYKTQYLYPWILAHPDEAYMLRALGYTDFDKDVRKWLNEHPPSWEGEQPVAPDYRQAVAR